MTTGTELIRRKGGNEAFALTTNLIKKADGTKFGKTESGNIWLDARKTSPYKFYQFWLNASDTDAESFIRIFTLRVKEEIDSLIQSHKGKPHERLLQKELAKDVTIRVHSENDYHSAVEASEILFGKATSESLKKLGEDDFLSVFEGVPQGKIAKNDLSDGVSIIDFISEKTGFLKSKGEAKRALEENSISVNKDKVTTDSRITTDHLVNGKYILIQPGKKNYFLVIADDGKVKSSM